MMDAAKKNTPALDEEVNALRARIEELEASLSVERESGKCLRRLLDSVNDRVLARDIEGNITGGLSVAGDVTGREEALDLSADVRHESEILAEIGRTVTMSTDISEVYEQFGENVRELIPAERVDIVSIDTDAETLTMEFAFGVGVDAPTAQVGYTRGLAGSIAEQMVLRRSGLRSVVSELDEGIEDSSPFFNTHALGMRSNISVPLRAKGKVIGMMGLMSRTADAFTVRHLSVAERIGAQIAGAVLNAKEYAARVEAEKALVESEQRFRQVADNIQSKGHIPS